MVHSWAIDGIFKISGRENITSRNFDLMGATNVTNHISGIIFMLIAQSKSCKTDYLLAGIEEGFEVGVVFAGFVIVHSQAGLGVVSC